LAMTPAEGPSGTRRVAGGRRLRPVGSPRSLHPLCRAQRCAAGLGRTLASGTGSSKPDGRERLGHGRRAEPSWTPGGRRRPRGRLLQSACTSRSVDAHAGSMLGSPPLRHAAARRVVTQLPLASAAHWIATEGVGVTTGVMNPACRGKTEQLCRAELGGRGRDRTCDRSGVNRVLSR
jgi:hypothetical protein